MMQCKVYYVIEGGSTHKRFVHYQKIRNDTVASNQNLIYTLKQEADPYLTQEMKSFGFQLLMQDEDAEFIIVDECDEIPDKCTIKLVPKLIGSVPIQVTDESKRLQILYIITVFDVVLTHFFILTVADTVQEDGHTILIRPGDVIEFEGGPVSIEGSTNMIVPENAEQKKKKKKKNNKKRKNKKKAKAESSEEEEEEDVTSSSSSEDETAVLK